MEDPVKYLAILLIPIVLITHMACSHNAQGSNGDEEQKKKEEIIVPVQVEALKKGPISSYILSSATLEAEMSVDVVAETTGVVEEIYAEEGDRVKKDKVLAVINFEELKLAKDKAEMALTEAENNFNRVKNMWESKTDQQLVSREEYENAEFNYRQKKLDYENARVKFEKSMIKAPFDGTVTQRYITVGQYQPLNQKAFSLVNEDILKVNVFIPEERISLIRKDMHADLVSEAMNRVFTGFVKRVSQVVDPATGTVKVTIYVKEDDPDLRPGMFVKVRILTDTIENALLVPKKAVVYQNDRKYVFLYENTEGEEGGKARQVELTSGYQNDQFFQGLNEELQENAQIIVAGQNGLKDGAKVRIADNG